MRRPTCCAAILFRQRSPRSEAGAKQQDRKEKKSFRQQWVEGFQPFRHPVIAASVIMFLCIIIGISGADVIFTAHVSSSGHSSLDVGYVFAALSAGLILATIVGPRYFSKWPLAIRLGGATAMIGLFEALVGFFDGLVGMAAAAFVLGLVSVVVISAAERRFARLAEEQNC